MKQITSLENKEVKYASSLLHKKYRGQENCFLVEGLKSMEAAMEYPELIRTIFIDAAKQEDFRLMTDHLPEKCCLVDGKIIKRICAVESPQGIVAVIKKPVTQLTDLAAAKGLLLLLDKISDPGNMGTIIRSAWALNAGGVLLTRGCVDPFSPKVVRSTMGGILNVRLAENAGKKEIAWLKEQGYRLVCTDLHTDRSFYHTDYREKKVVVIGSEAAGVSQDIKDLSDEFIKIPIKPKADSLNAAVACAIIMQEAYRQQTQGAILL